MTEQITFLIAHIELNFIPSEVGMENNIAVLIAGYGVFLEHRRWLLVRIYPDPLPVAVDQFDRYCQDIGVYLILTAIAIEAADLMFLAFNNWGLNSPHIKYLEVLCLFATNLMALALIGHFLRQTMGQFGLDKEHS